MRIHYFQHVSFEGPAHIEAWARSRGHRVSSSRLDLSQPLPPLEEIDLLVILGGPMGVDDEKRFQWLAEEKRYLEHAVRSEKMILGVCLGAQLVARVLGARVFQNAHKEIGWFPLECVSDRAPGWPCGMPERFDAFHWHGDTFDLPRGSVHLARSRACENQAFSYGPATLALQFHLEATAHSVSQLVDHCPQDLRPGAYTQSAEQMKAVPAPVFERMHALLFRILDGLSSQVMQ
ncbi:MAG: type 1 glutamine amidotransferase [Acidobacteria bacterium]|nr:type 1 glutamine amidotransferase [Acidobacteriota bacterium]